MTDALAAWDKHVGAVAAAKPDVVLPVTPHPIAEQARPQQLLEWLERAKGVSAETAAAFGVYVRPHRFHLLQGGDPQPAVVLPYLHGGELVNRAYRLTKGEVVEYEGAALPSLFNIDAVDADDPQEVVIVQREIDVLAMHEAGYPQAVCLPQLPRPQDLAAGQEDRRFRPLATHEQLLQRVRRFVLAMDASPVGIEMREELARRLGRHRCRLVQWPEPITSAGEALTKAGKEGLFTAIQQAEAYPLEGVHRITVQAMLDLRDQPPPPVMKGGIGPLDAKVSFPTDGRLILVSGIPNHGKALALDTPIPTPTGWTTMGDIRAGDWVYSADGSITRVLRAWDVLHGRNCYRVVFNDGSSIIADEEHLWVTRCEKARRSEYQSKIKRGDRQECLKKGTDQRHLKTNISAKTTAQIAATLWDTSCRDTHPRLNHSVAVTLPLEGGNQWPLQIGAYTFGAWLGDGNSDGGGFTCADDELIAHMRADGAVVIKGKSKLRWHIHGIKTTLRAWDLLHNKHIPIQCLRAPRASRQSLLQGLMDTDGYASRDGTAEFCTIRQGLADAVFELAASLGYKPRLYQGRATIGRNDCGPKYRVCFNPDQHTFRLTRKLAKVRTSAQSSARAGWRKIVAVEPVPSVPVRCITVEHPSKLYLAGRSMIPTHNTPFVRHLMMHQMEHHDRKWAVFSPEERPWQRFAATCAQWLIGKPFWPSQKHGGLIAMDRQEIIMAAQWLSRRLYMIVGDAERDLPTIDWLLDRAKELVLAEGVTDVWVDPWNEIAHSRAAAREDEYLRETLMRLQAFSARHGTNWWVNVHPITMRPKPGEKIQAPGPYDISGGSMWFNKADLMLVVHRPADQPLTEIHVRKAKHPAYGRRGDMVEIAYDQATGRYTTPTG